MNQENVAEPKSMIPQTYLDASNADLPVGVVPFASDAHTSIASDTAPAVSNLFLLNPIASSGRQLLTMDQPGPVSTTDPHAPHPSPLQLEENLVQYGWVSVVGVMIMAFVFLSSYWVRNTKYARLLPESSVAIITGTVVGSLIYLFDPELVVPSDGSPSPFVFSPKLFFFVFLPPIILEAGFTLNTSDFFSNIGVIALYAGPGVLFSTLFIAAGALGASHIGLFGPVVLTYLESLMFGALLSVTDSVATVSILGSPELAVDSSLFSIVVGESIVNDAIGILLFDTLAKFARAPQHFSLADLLLELVLVFTGSLVLGLALGLLCSLTCKRLRLADHPALEFLLVVLFAYSSYAGALVLQLSGVVSLFVCGVVLGHYNWHNLSVPSKTITRYGFKSLSLFCEMAVFVYLGITLAFSLTPLVACRWSLTGCFVTVVLVWAARALYIFPLSWLANLRRAHPLTRPMQTIIFAGGLRGAVSFALALNVHGPSQDLLVTCCLSMVIGTSLLGGPVVDRVVRHCSAQIRRDHALLPDRDPGAAAANQVWADSPSIDDLVIAKGQHDEEAPAPVFTIEKPVSGAMETSAMNKVLAQAQWGSLHQVWETFDAGVMKDIFGGPGAASHTQ